MPVRMTDPVRIVHPDGRTEETTLGALADAHRLRYTTGEHTGPKRKGERKMVRHWHAELIPQLNGGAEGYWPISEAAYRSRTGQPQRFEEAT